MRQMRYQGPHSGGSLVCCGSDFRATFQDCTFESCTVYAVHGAAVTLRACTLREGLTGLVAHGAGTAALLDSCTFDRCFNGFTAERGAAVTAVRCCCNHTRAFLLAHDPGTHAACADCSFSGVVTRTDRLARGVGAETYGARVSLRSCTIQNFMFGVVAHGRTAVVEVEECVLRRWHTRRRCV